MKKVLLILVCIYCQSVTAQITESGWKKLTTPTSLLKKTKPEIIDDGIDGDGNRIITCAVKGWRDKSDHSLQIGAIAQKKEGDIVLGLQFLKVQFDFPFKIEKDSPVLIKFGDDSVIKKTITYAGEPHKSYRSIMGPPSPLYSSFFICELSEDEITMLEKGLKKMRFEVNDDQWDIEDDKNKIGPFLVEEFKLIKESLSKDKNFEDGF